MNCERSAGWTIGADGVDIDLADLTFRGAPFLVGIQNRGGYHQFTVRDGALSNWLTAVIIEGASHSRILDISGYGVSITGGDDNQLSGSGISRFAGSDTTRLVVEDSQIFGGIGSRASPAIRFTGNGARFLRNEILAGDFYPAVLLEGSSNDAVGNRIDGPERGGIVVGAGEGTVLSENEVVAGTIFTGGEAAEAGDGIFIRPTATGTVLTGNVLTGNEGDGIEGQSGSTELRHNGANDNGDFGIDAVAGVSDLGGNTASGNGNPLQCRNVFCQ